MHHAPHRFAEVRHDPHQLQARAVRGRDVAEIEPQQQVLRAGGEAVVDREVPQVEEEIAHTAVLVIDDPHVVAVQQEVRVQQVVVARTVGERMLGERGLDVAGSGMDLFERRRRRDPALGRDPAIVLNDPEHGERRRDRRAGMDRSHRSDDGAQHVLALQVLFRDVGALHEPRDERAEVGGTRRPRERRRRPRRRKRPRSPRRDRSPTAPYLCPRAGPRTTRRRCPP